MRKNPAWRLPTASILLLAIAACHSAATRIHPLITAVPDVRLSTPTTMLRVDDVHVPPEWDRIEIMSPDPTGGLKINDLDRWPAPLAQATRQVLSADLDARMPAGSVIYPHLSKSPGALGISVEVLQFTMAESHGSMQVSWVITPAQAPDTAIRRTATLTTAVSGTDVSAVAHAWSALVGQLADRLATETAAFHSPGGT